MKKEVRRPVRHVINGIEYEGVQVVTGTYRLSQTVLFGGREKPDSQHYKPSQVEEMNRTAKQLLWELVAGRSLGG